MSTQRERGEAYEMFSEWFKGQNDKGLNISEDDLGEWQKDLVMEYIYEDFVHTQKRDYADDYSEIYIDINTVKLSYLDRARIIIECLDKVNYDKTIFSECGQMRVSFNELFWFEDYQEMIAKVIDTTIKDDIAVINEVRGNLERALRDVNDCGEAEQLEKRIKFKLDW